LYFAQSVVEPVETTGMMVFSVPSTSSGTDCKVNAAAMAHTINGLHIYTKYRYIPIAFMQESGE
jgi:hypothetical protein